MENINAMTHEELVQEVYKLLLQLSPAEQHHLFNDIISKRKQEATK